MKIIFLTQKHLESTAQIMVEAYWDSIVKARVELLKRIKSNECFIALDNNEILGLFIYTRDFSHYANYLEDIIVSKNHRRKGVSQELLRKYISISRAETLIKQNYALSSTTTSNKPSVAMHLKFGFKKIGVLNKLHYGKDELFFAYDLRGVK